jgi:hypothetical protein
LNSVARLQEGGCQASADHRNRQRHAKHCASPVLSKRPFHEFPLPMRAQSRARGADDTMAGTYP